MKKVMYYIVLVITATLVMPLAILFTIAYCYMRLVHIVIDKPIEYVWDAAPMPKWFKCLTDYINKLVGA